MTTHATAVVNLDGTAVIGLAGTEHRLSAADSGAALEAVVGFVVTEAVTTGTELRLDATSPDGTTTALRITPDGGVSVVPAIAPVPVEPPAEVDIPAGITAVQEPIEEPSVSDLTAAEEISSPVVAARPPRRRRALMPVAVVTAAAVILALALTAVFVVLDRGPGTRPVAAPTATVRPTAKAPTLAPVPRELRVQVPKPKAGVDVEFRVWSTRAPVIATVTVTTLKGHVVKTAAARVKPDSSGDGHGTVRVHVPAGRYRWTVTVPDGAAAVKGTVSVPKPPAPEVKSTSTYVPPTTSGTSTSSSSSSGSTSTTTKKSSGGGSGPVGINDGTDPGPVATN